MLYIRQSPVRLERVVDDNSDLMVVLKEVSKANLINDMIMMKITRLLAKIKTGQINSIDENLLREEIIRKIKVSQVYPYPEVAKLIKGFIKGNTTLVDMLPELYRLALMKKRALEFRTLYKRLSHATVDPTQPPTDGNTTQGTDPNTPTTSPVASALTGTPLLNDPKKDQVVKAPPKPEPIKPKTWEDIRPLFEASQIRSNNLSCLAFFLFLNEKYGDDILSIKKECSSMGLDFGELGWRFADFEMVNHFMDYTPMATQLEAKYPDITKIVKPYGNDIKKVKNPIMNIFSNRSRAFDVAYFYEFNRKQFNLDLFDIYTPMIEMIKLNMKDSSFDRFVYDNYVTKLVAEWVKTDLNLFVIAYNRKDWNEFPLTKLTYDAYLFDNKNLMNQLTDRTIELLKKDNLMHFMNINDSLRDSLLDRFLDFNKSTEAYKYAFAQVGIDKIISRNGGLSTEDFMKLLIQTDIKPLFK